MKLVFATNNQHKLDEVRKVVTDDIQIISLSDINCYDDIPETAETLEGNALQKVHYIKEHFGYDCFADDTGLEVEALNNAPGVLSARYGSINGEHTDPKKNNERIIKELTGVSNRFAKFVTAMYYYDGTNLISSIGELCGEITTEPRGTKSFGYSSIFEIPEYKMTLAEIDDELRYAINHRGNASRLLIKQLKDYMVKK